MWLVALDAVGPWIPPQVTDILGFGGDAQALRPVVAAAVAHLLRLPRSHPDVEDCASEALPRALEGRGRLRAGEPLRPWLLGIARHVALDALRERKRLARVTGSPGDGSEQELDLPDPAPLQDERFEHAARAASVQRALATLPDSQRRALRLFHDEGIGYRAIAERLEVPIGTVCTWIARARQTLARALDDEARTS